MEKLLEFATQYLQVLYLNPAYRFTDSKTCGLADIDASISLSSDTLRWDITNDRGQIDVAVVPLQFANDDNWFWLSLIRQYLNGSQAAAEGGSDRDSSAWLSLNLDEVESCSQMRKTLLACAPSW